jgi:hypothetical protein
LRVDSNGELRDEYWNCMLNNNGISNRLPTEVFGKLRRCRNKPKDNHSPVDEGWGSPFEYVQHQITKYSWHELV